MKSNYNNKDEVQLLLSYRYFLGITKEWVYLFNLDFAPFRIEFIELDEHNNEYDYNSILGKYLLNSIELTKDFLLSYGNNINYIDCIISERTGMSNFRDYDLLIKSIYGEQKERVFNKVGVAMVLKNNLNQIGLIRIRTINDIITISVDDCYGIELINTID